MPQTVNKNSFIIAALKAIYLKDDEYIDPGQDDSSNSHLRLLCNVERLVGHGQRNNVVILQEGLDCDDDGVTG